MPTTKTVKVLVENLTKFGYKADGKFVNYSKQLSENDKSLVVAGAEFEAEYYVSDAGKEYLNKIIARSPKVQAPPVDTERAEKVVATVAKSIFTPSFQKKDDGEKMSKAEWNAKDRSQLIGGLSHDAAAITASMCAVDTKLSPLVFYKELLTGMLRIREEVK